MKQGWNTRDHDSAARIGATLARIRRERGLSQNQLSVESGIVQTQIARYELGKQEMFARNLARLAWALSCTTDELLASEFEAIDNE